MRTNSPTSSSTILRRLAVCCLTTAALLIAAPAAHAWDPASNQVAPGVFVGGIDVSGLERAVAARTVLAAYQSPPVVLRHDGVTYRRTAGRLGQVVRVEAAITAAMQVGRTGTAPPPRTDVPLSVGVNRIRVAAWLKQIAPKVYRAPRNATYRIRDGRPRIVGAVPGARLRTVALTGSIVSRLKSHDAGRSIRVRIGFLSAVRAKVSAAELPKVVVIDRSAHTLKLFSPHRLIRRFGVATGQASYPTPIGNFTIVTKQRHPWWFPPDSDWAEGAEPVPPGPGNPLGTRWMGLSASGVGIHGTPNAASIGYSASHGCIRMRIPDAERLFRMVRVGTPVHIVR